MSQVSPQPLRRQLLVAALLLLAAMVATAAWLEFATYRNRVEELIDEAQQAALRTAALVDRELTGFDRLAFNLSVNVTLRDLDAEAVAPLLQSRLLRRPFLLDVVLIGQDSRTVARGASAPEISGGRVELVAGVLEAGERVVSPMRTSSSGIGHVTISYPVRNASGTMVGVLICYVNPQRMDDALGAMQLPSGAVLTLSEAGGRVLGSRPDQGQDVDRLLDVSWGGAGARAPGQRDRMDGVRRVYAEAIVAGGPWLVTAGIPTSVAFDRSTPLWTQSVAILAIGLGGWFVVALVFSRRLTQSVGHLEAAADRVASGDFAPIDLEPMATREFAQLQLAFDQMLRRFNETRAALDAQMAEERRMLEEVRSLQRQVIRQERLAAVGQLVSGVAHEINNPLQAILGFAELLQMQEKLPDETKRDLALIQKESGRACGIIRNLALFTRQQTGDAERVRLTDVVVSVVELRQRRLESEDIELRLEDASSQYVVAVLAELQQVALNFVGNAEQAIVKSGRQPGCVTIRTRDEGDRVILEVEDTGPGVSREHEAKLFQPFFTTKPVGEGTGLGLSVSYGIIDSLGGQIGYRTAPAGGAIFYFDLPAASE
jgi:C4-dicarboxylate-specific signal transduction histidine kinase